MALLLGVPDVEWCLFGLEPAEPGTVLEEDVWMAEGFGDGVGGEVEVVAGDCGGWVEGDCGLDVGGCLFVVGVDVDQVGFGVESAGGAEFSGHPERHLVLVDSRVVVEAVVELCFDCFHVGVDCVAGVVDEGSPGVDAADGFDEVGAVEEDRADSPR